MEPTPPTECGECYALPAAANYLSPGLAHGGEGDRRAIELKFLVPRELADSLRDRARAELQIDPFADQKTGRYNVCSLYLDTPAFDIYHRTSVTDGAKFRFRRYNDSDELFLERKRRQRGVVSKHRELLSLDALVQCSIQASPIWDDAKRFGLVPSCAVVYERDAFASRQTDAPYRVTIDNDLAGFRFRRSEWRELSEFLRMKRAELQVPRSAPFRPLVAGNSVVEFKFIDTLPIRLKRWIEEYQIAPIPFSKYRTALADSNQSLHEKDGVEG